jgi:hypothetical protein
MLNTSAKAATELPPKQKTYAPQRNSKLLFFFYMNLDTKRNSIAFCFSYDTFRLNSKMLAPKLSTPTMNIAIRAYSIFCQTKPFMIRD